ncbi:hypothetical protein [Thermocatellispora tengchongensis]|nr:hypothetical protein [Thermocatellispora tengchongensis]
MGPGLPGLLAELTEGRGGRFVRDHDGETVYLPGGGEPLIYLGSGRGVPYHAAIEYSLWGDGVSGPRFAAPEALPRGPAHFRRQVWPLVAKDLAYAYYRELLTAHPSRARMTWAEFERAYSAQEWGSAAMRALVRRAVPRFPDRLDLDRLDRPLAGIRFGDHAGLRRWMVGYIGADVERRADPAHSADLAVGHMARAVRDALAGTRHADPWLDGFTAFMADGPPGAWLEELRALALAGVVVFLGAGVHVRQDATGGWRAAGPTVPGAVQARALLDARGIVEKQEEHR